MLYLAILNSSTIFLFQRLNLDCVVFIVAILIIPNSANLISSAFQKNWIEIIDLQIKFKRSAYNQLFLPNTQTGKFKYDEVKLTNDLSNDSMANWAKYKFYINPYKDKLYTVSATGKIYFTNLSDFITLKVDMSVALKSDFDLGFKVETLALGHYGPGPGKIFLLFG